MLVPKRLFRHNWSTAGFRSRRLLQRASRQRQHGNAFAAFALATRAARLGEPDGCAQVGQCYLTGNGVPRSDAAAAHWLAKAAEKGHLASQVALANLHLRGVSLSGQTAGLFAITAHAPDYRAARRWAERAAHAGSMDGQAILGILLSHGPEEMRDLAAAERLLRQAAEGGSTCAAFGLGLVILKCGSRCVEAATWMRRAAEQGHQVGLYILGAMLDDGLGIDRDVAEAVKMYHRSAELGFPAAQRRYGLACLEGRTIAVNDLEGESWLRRAARAGDAAAAALVDESTQQ